MMATVISPATISTKAPAPLIMEPVTVLDNHDGDSFHASFAMDVLIPGAEPKGWKEDCRLAHVNAAELATPLGKGAQAAVAKWLADRGMGPFRLHVWGREKYGRLLSDLEDPTGALLSAYVLTIAGTVPMLVREQLHEVHGQARP